MIFNASFYIMKKTILGGLFMGSIFDNFIQKGKNQESNGSVEYENEQQRTTDPVKISAKVTGTVQGVGFRFSTKQVAMELGIGGIVRNESDGSVYVEANGSKEEIAQFIEALRKGPSPAAEVEKVLVKYEESLKVRDKFTQAN